MRLECALTAFCETSNWEAISAREIRFFSGGKTAKFSEEGFLKVFIAYSPAAALDGKDSAPHGDIERTARKCT